MIQNLLPGKLVCIQVLLNWETDRVQDHRQAEVVPQVLLCVCPFDQDYCARLYSKSQPCPHTVHPEMSRGPASAEVSSDPEQGWRH